MIDFRVARDSGTIPRRQERYIRERRNTLSSLIRQHEMFLKRGLNCWWCSLLPRRYASGSFGRNVMRNLFASILLFVVSIPATAQSTRHRFTFDDDTSIHSAVAVAVSPDGKSVLYRVRFGGAKGPDNTVWQLIATAGGESRPLSIPEQFWPAGFTRDGAALYGMYEVNKMAQLATLPLASAYTPPCCGSHSCPAHCPAEGHSFRLDFPGWLALRSPGRPATSRSAGGRTYRH